MRIPRVLFVADKLGYPGGVSYGGTTYALNVLPALMRAGVPLTTCFLREPHAAAVTLRALGVHPTFLSARRLNPSVLLPLIRLARQNGCEILHATGYASTIISRAATRFIAARTVVHVNDLHRPGVAIRGLEAALSRPMDTGICVSHASAHVVTDVYHVRPERVHVIPNGIDLPRFRDVADDARERMRETLGIAPDARLLGMVARIYPVKGHRPMLRMMPAILQGCPGVRLLLVGDGPERAACEALVDELGLRASVLFTGQRSDVAELLMACDAFVLPSETEGLPTGAIEALAMGRPVVGYDVDGVGEVVDHGVTGCLVPAGDAAAFTAAVVALLNDRARLEAYSANALEAAKRFGVEHHVGGLVDCYRELAVSIDGCEKQPA